MTFAIDPIQTNKTHPTYEVEAHDMTTHRCHLESHCLAHEASSVVVD